MLKFEMDVLAADLRSRTIEGVAVPYGEVGLIEGKRYRFLPGSLELGRPRPPLLVDHDRGRPVGVLAELVDSDSNALARFHVDATQDGDTALVQAASGSRGSLSVGAELVEATDGDGGVIDVARARIHEVSLLALGAFVGATVTRVAAEADDDADDEPVDEPVEPDPDQTELELGDSEEETMQEATASPPVILAERTRAPRELGAGEYVQHLIRAQRGERDAIELIQAALTETVSADVPGLLPPTYQAGLIGPAPADRTLWEVFRGRPLPGVGLTIQKPEWTTMPNGAWAANVEADATTGKAVISLAQAAIERWDWATAMPYLVVQRSSPDAIDTILGAAIDDFHLDVEIKIATLLDVTAGTPNAAIKLGAGIGAFYTRCRRAPEIIVVAADVWGLLADAGALSTPNAAGGVTSGSGLRSTFAGIPCVSSGAVAAGTKYLATRRSLDVRVSEPVQLTANAIGALNVEFGVVGEGLFDADYPLEVMELAAGAPVVDLNAELLEAVGGKGRAK